AASGRSTPVRCTPPGPEARHDSELRWPCPDHTPPAPTDQVPAAVKPESVTYEARRWESLSWGRGRASEMLRNMLSLLGRSLLPSCTVSPWLGRSTVKVKPPMRTASPPRRVACCTRSPLTKTPLRLLRSCTCQRLLEKVNRQCRRLTSGSGRRTSA